MGWKKGPHTRLAWQLAQASLAGAGSWYNSSHPCLWQQHRVLQAEDALAVLDSCSGSSWPGQSVANSSTDPHSGFRCTCQFRCNFSLWSMKLPRKPNCATPLPMLVCFLLASGRPWFSWHCGVAWICSLPGKSSIWTWHHSSVSILIPALSFVSTHRF